MGLDQYAYRVSSKYDYETVTETIVKKEIHYWRKHNALQGWMENLWVIKTSKEVLDFNCEQMRLTMEDLKQLKKCIINQTLPKTVGFFYGSDTSRDDTRKEDDLEFIEKAMDAIRDGEQVFYSCSW